MFHYIGAFLVTFMLLGSTPEKEYKGVLIAEENRCSEYNREDYQYDLSIERDIIEKNLGNKLYSPYTRKYYKSAKDLDIDHIVSQREAHDSGLCSRSKATRKQYGSDLLNLTLTPPEVNRCYRKNSKCGKDVSEWMPEHNKCWFIKQGLEVRRNYDLSIDREDVKAIKKQWGKCYNFSIKP